MTFAMIWAYNLYLLWWPKTLVADYSFMTFDKIDDYSDPTNLRAAAAAAAVLAPMVYLVLMVLRRVRQEPLRAEGTVCCRPRGRVEPRQQSTRQDFTLQGHFAAGPHAAAFHTHTTGADLAEMETAGEALSVGDLTK